MNLLLLSLFFLYEFSSLYDLMGFTVFWLFPVILDLRGSNIAQNFPLDNCFKAKKELWGWMSRSKDILKKTQSTIFWDTLYNFITYLIVITPSLFSSMLLNCFLMFSISFFPNIFCSFLQTVNNYNVAGPSYQENFKLIGNM